jgi:hypothetical protein
MPNFSKKLALDGSPVVPLILLPYVAVPYKILHVATLVSARAEIIIYKLPETGPLIAKYLNMQNSK